jgi:nicotinate-nucleotide pyrophosphorylase (carboxylating)
VLEKYAVRAGGGSNHRFGLYDGVLIKDNHIVAAGSIALAVASARAVVPHTIRVEVECDTEEQVAQALESGVDIIMLDNMTVEQMRAMVSLINGKALVEASGNITEDTIVGVAETGVDLISVGKLTHSIKSLDIGLDIVNV